MKPEDLYTEAGFLLGVTGLALIWPPLAFIGAAAFFLVFAVVWYIKSPTPDDAAPEAPVTGQDA